MLQGPARECGREAVQESRAVVRAIFTESVAREMVLQVLIPDGLLAAHRGCPLVLFNMGR